MSNAATHMTRSALMVGGAHAAHEWHRDQRITAAPVVSGSFAALLGSLPDWIEPATNPHHRQFFHSLVFGAAVAYAGYRMYQWQTETPLQELLRWAGMIVSGAYVAHLICDAGTPRSLPLLGRL